MGAGQELYNKAKLLIPGGTMLLSKRPEMFLPNLWPAYYQKALGCDIWDLDGNKYTDMSYMGIGSCVLGYAHPVVNEAATNAIKNGSMSTLNAPEEVELAEMMCTLHPWADMARYTRSGGEAMAVAVRIARAFSGKDKVLFCGYHGWHDWYLAANLSEEKALDGHLLPGLNPAGLPRQLKDTAYPFSYNDTSGFLEMIDKHKENLGAVVIEVVRNSEPNDSFLPTIRKTTKELGVPLVVDEITAGFRLNPGGAHLKYNIEPDIAVFGKGISNGIPMGIIIGKKSIMDSAQDSFISSTYWTDRIGPSAAIAAIKFFIENNVHDHLVEVGSTMQEVWKNIANDHNVAITVGGRKPLGHFSFNHKQNLALKTLFTQEMLFRGFLATTAFYASYAHSTEHIEQYKKAAHEAFGIIEKAISSRQIMGYLKSDVCQSGFKRLT